MPNNTKLNAIYRELIADTHYIELNIKQALNFTYSSRSPLYTLNDIFTPLQPIKQAQMQAFQHAAKSYEEIIPVSFRKLEETELEENVNNIKLYNAYGNYAAYAGDNYSVAITKVSSSNNKFLYVGRLIVYNFNKRGEEFISKATKDTSYLYHVYRHELGHALGLDHPDSHDDTTMKHAIMSYSLHPSYQENSFYPVTPLLLDTLVLQAAYGQNHKTRSGDNYYSWNNKELSKIRCLWDASGQDTFDLRQSKHACFFDMRDGQFSSIGSHPWGAPADSNFSLAYTTELENLKGTEKGDIVFLNRHNNIVNLGKGNDTVYLSDRSIHTSISEHRSNKIQQSVEYGWGHDIYYSQGGKDRFIIDVLDPTKLKFIKRNKSLKIAYRDRNSKISSITIANYHPDQFLFLVRASSMSEKKSIRNKFRISAIRAQKRFRTGIFPESMMAVNGGFSKRIQNYDKNMSSVNTSLKVNNYSQYIALAL